MSTALDALELRRIVWRHETGRLSFDRARADGLEEEYVRALDALRTLEDGRSTLRAHDSALLRDYDEALRGARRGLEDGAARAALDHLLHARALLARMHTLLEAHAAVGRASEAVERLADAVRLPRLRALPCLDAPARLLAAARERMRAGAWTRAAYLAAACARQAAALEPGAPPGPAREAALRAAFGELRALCAATRDLLPEPAADPWGEGTLDAAAALAEEGWFVLAERMAEELTALLAPRARFRAALEQDPGGAADAVAELRRRLSAEPGGENPWSAATRLLWRARVDDGLRRIRGEQARLEGLRPEGAPDCARAGRGGPGPEDSHHQPR